MRTCTGWRCCSFSFRKDRARSRSIRSCARRRGAKRMRLWLATAVVLLGALPAQAQIVIYDSSPRIIQVPQSAVAAPVDNERVQRVERKPQPRRALSNAAAEPASKPRAEL